MSKKAIIVGASSGIGESLAYELDKRGYALGLTARRLDRLESIAAKLSNQAVVQTMDVTKVEDARAGLDSLVHKMGDEVDEIIYNSGVAQKNPKLDWEDERAVVETNVYGFTAIANKALEIFFHQGRGHFVGVSSVAGTRGIGSSRAYSASKSYMSNYLEGMRVYVRLHSKAIHVTDIRPGFIETPMTKGLKEMFWEISSEQAAVEIADCIEVKKESAYVPQKWTWVAKAMRMMPDRAYSELLVNQERKRL